jgi:hypothetical protein
MKRKRVPVYCSITGNPRQGVTFEYQLERTNTQSGWLIYKANRWEYKNTATPGPSMSKVSEMILQLEQ